MHKHTHTKRIFFIKYVGKSLKSTNCTIFNRNTITYEYSALMLYGLNVNNSSNNLCFHVVAFMNRFVDLKDLK